MIGFVGAAIQVIKEVAACSEELNVSEAFTNSIESMINSILDVPEAEEVPSYNSINVDALEANSIDIHSRLIVDESKNITLDPNSTYVKDGITYETDDNGIIYSVDGKLIPNATYSQKGLEYKVDEKGDIEKQSIADNAAKEYNNKYNPVERAHQKGYNNVIETENGGVSFQDSDSLYVTEDGEKAIVDIEATGNRSSDFDRANEKMGFIETPDGYVWHHVDNYNVETNTITMELVKDEAHNATKPHAGGCAQYDAVNGPSYNSTKGI